MTVNPRIVSTGLAILAVAVLASIAVYPAVLYGSHAFGAAWALFSTGLIFWAHSLRESRGFWDPLRSRAAAALAVFAILAVQAARPTSLMVSPERRRVILEALSPAFPVQDPATLSPLASRLRGHVLELSEKIGERSAYQPDAQEKAKDHIVAQFRAAGYSPGVLDYVSGRKMDFERQIPYHNVEALLGTTDGDGSPVWIVGAHYDSAPGTRGADDNASGVAVMLEAARLLKERGTPRKIRFVAFGTEEPPAFGTRDMGSYRYARDLAGRGVRVAGVLNLEMLGYFNPKPASQLYPPFLSLFYPDHGDFIGLVSNISSIGLMRSFKRSWQAGSAVPIQATVLPSVFSSVALSDQLNFWPEGYRAVMLTDTSLSLLGQRGIGFPPVRHEHASGLHHVLQKSGMISVVRFGSLWILKKAKAKFSGYAYPDGKVRFDEGELKVSVST